MNEKQDNQLNMALELTPEQLNKSQELSVGFNEADNSWDLIVKYQGSLDRVRAMGVNVRELSGGYAILNVPEILVDTVSNLEEIIFVEKPKSLEFGVLNGKRVSCVNQVQTPDFSVGAPTEGGSPYSVIGGEGGLFGEGVIIGIADSGIDYTNNAFRNADGTTRILKLWDQVTDTVFDEEQINEALSAANPYNIVNSRDVSGHGTHVAGIAAGNYAEDRNNNLGIATKSRLIIVKMAEPSRDSFPKTTQLMEAVDFIVKQSNEYGMPFVVNISFGNTYGSHDGTSLLSTYFDSVIDGNRMVMVIGSGNEGDSAGHAGGYIGTDNTGRVGNPDRRLLDNNNDAAAIELQVSEYQGSFGVQLWKNYVDIWGIRVIAPSGISTSTIDKDGYIFTYELDNTTVKVLYGTPKPYSEYQEIYMSLIPRERYVKSGIWTIEIISERTVNGRYDLWLPTSGSVNENTRFLTPDPYVTLTVPSATTKAITVGAYNSNNDTIAPFSGRGFTRENNQVKPDIVAPGVNILSASNTGGTVMRSGTSMATPFVSGSAAIMLEWGIVRGNDPFLYGEKVKAYFIRGARHLSSVEKYPSELAGWGALCLRDSLPG